MGRNIYRRKTAAALICPPLHPKVCLVLNLSACQGIPPALNLTSVQLLLCRNGHAAGDVIVSQLTAAVASMLKRGWLESSKEERHAFFAETEDIASSQGSREARRASIRVLEVNLTHSAILQQA